MAQRVTQHRTRTERAQAAVDDFELRRPIGGAVGFEHAASGRRTLVRLEAAELRRGDGVVLRDVDVALDRGTRVHVAGANGAGITTLLRALLTATADTGEQVGWLPQELDDPSAELVRLGRLDPQARGRVLGTLALLGVDPDRVLVSDDPSPGEARKLALARLLVAPISLLVLDEPTNHLDLPSIERLEEALSRYGGALLLVTHDDRLAAAGTEICWEIADGRVIEAGVDR